MRKKHTAPLAKVGGRVQEGFDSGGGMPPKSTARRIQLGFTKTRNGGKIFRSHLQERGKKK